MQSFAPCEPSSLSELDIKVTYLKLPYLTHLHQVDSSTTTLWTGLCPIAGCLVVNCYYYMYSVL